MKRSDWMVMPDGRRVHRSLDGRRYAETKPEGWHKVVVAVSFPADAGADSPTFFDMPLADFEALLFGEAPTPDYVAAAVKFAETETEWGEEVRRPRADTTLRERDAARAAFLALYRERHGG